MKTFGQVLKEARKAKKMTCREMGDLASLSVGRISDIEHDRNNNVSSRTASKLEKVLELNDGELNSILLKEHGLLTNNKTCGTCRFWSFKSSGEGQQCWGKCTSEKMREAFYLSVDFPTLGCKGTDEYQQFAEWVKKYVDIRVEENAFGCIHHERIEE